VAGAGGRFFDVSNYATADIAKAINADGVHILIDMDAHFRGSRLEVMSLESAPVQVKTTMLRFEAPHVAGWNFSLFT
jgi:predicted O-linked N-acetylglucosamine transferase (SPINDLY family)